MFLQRQHFEISLAFSNELARFESQHIGKRAERFLIWRVFQVFDYHWLNAMIPEKLHGFSAL